MLRFGLQQVDRLCPRAHRHLQDLAEHLAVFQFQRRRQGHDVPAIADGNAQESVGEGAAAQQGGEGRRCGILVHLRLPDNRVERLDAKQRPFHLFHGHAHHRAVIGRLGSGQVQRPKVAVQAGCAGQHRLQAARNRLASFLLLVQHQQGQRLAPGVGRAHHGHHAVRHIRLPGEGLLQRTLQFHGRDGGVCLFVVVRIAKQVAHAAFLPCGERRQLFYHVFQFPLHLGCVQAAVVLVQVLQGLVVQAHRQLARVFFVVARGGRDGVAFKEIQQPLGVLVSAQALAKLFAFVWRLRRRFGGLGGGFLAGGQARPGVQPPFEQDRRGRGHPVIALRNAAKLAHLAITIRRRKVQDTVRLHIVDRTPRLHDLHQRTRRHQVLPGHAVQKFQPGGGAEVGLVDDTGGLVLQDARHIQRNFVQVLGAVLLNHQPEDAFPGRGVGAGRRRRAPWRGRLLVQSFHNFLQNVIWHVDSPFPITNKGGFTIIMPQAGWPLRKLSCIDRYIANNKPQLSTSERVQSLPGQAMGAVHLLPGAACLAGDFRGGAIIAAGARPAYRTWEGARLALHSCFTPFWFHRSAKPKSGCRFT